MFDYLANPTRFLKIASYAEPVAWGVFALAGLTGLGLAFIGSPADYQQGETVRIMYIHAIRMDRAVRLPDDGGGCVFLSGLEASAG